MRDLLTSLDWTRLGFYKSVLDEAGIASFIRNEHTAQLINVLIAPCQPSLCVVNDDDYDTAMALLQPHHDQTASSGAAKARNKKAEPFPAPLRKIELSGGLRRGQRP